MNNCKTCTEREEYHNAVCIELNNAGIPTVIVQVGEYDGLKYSVLPRHEKALTKSTDNYGFPSYSLPGYLVDNKQNNVIGKVNSPDKMNMNSSQYAKYIMGIIQQISQKK